MIAAVFACEEHELAGVLYRPELCRSVGVLVVVGGPQYRIGSHRQFVYLARFLAGRGIPVFTFDYRGMGDSAGEFAGFEAVDTDIRCAMSAFQRECEEVKEIVIWGLCDGATAAAFYAAGDSRVKGLVLVNPWVYSEQGAARAYLKHYYVKRFFSLQFWKKVLSREYSPLRSLRSFWNIARTASVHSINPDQLGALADGTHQSSSADSSGNLLHRFTRALGEFKEPVLIVLSGNDLTAAEFRDAAAQDSGLSRILARNNLRQQLLVGADHTFSKEEWRTRVEHLTANWCLSLQDQRERDSAGVSRSLRLWKKNKPAKS
jgi:exosortase A-associated hydrolase 1